MNHTVLHNKTIIKSDYLNGEVYNLLDKTFEIPDQYSYNIYNVSKEYIARPDLISLDAYGTSVYCDVICKLNGISNPFELNEGMLLVLPSPDYIQNFVVHPNPLEQEEDNNKIVPTTKTKTSTRKTNEAIIGDSRFKINASAGVIIY